jgi:hypothetical protein
VVWLVLFALPVVKMLLLGLFLIGFARSNPAPGEPVEVRQRFGPRPGLPRPRSGRGGPRRSVATRRLRAPR